ncbi:MAG: SDR family NAD(P)-dependent oxidoreductase [Pseudacidovorax sp.]|uniref:SDR family NAD(P)-dependent oxidoreductase n=1 Tax=Pseudacidovorax sp. TaxID=1934311 RepID=UPI001B40EDB1|nr:SDR family NAD(P)-dependent oxidoreductase [Pseudacidovorax sp.]MBP6894569.1 SDR family NAD(P)-dependent oxidoreductase [Pseudacidovorax sp.]
MNESKQCVAILGAGPGLGQALAREYGIRGHAVALVARRIEPLQALCADLAQEGIEAAAFSADFRPSADNMQRLFAAIRGRFGEVHALYYGPNAPEAFTAAATLTVADVQDKMDLFLYGLMDAVAQVLPDMRRRQAGSILVGLGGSAIHGMPYMSGPGRALAAARNYLHSLHGEMAREGIHVGMLVLSAVIRQSGWHTAMASGAVRFDLPPGFSIPEIEPHELAARLLAFADARQAAELIYPPMP